MQNRFWQIFITLPPVEGEGRWKQNKTLGVVASTMQEAIAIVSDAYPGATFWTIQHRGEVNHNVAEYKDGWAHSEERPH